jgi:2-dehydropantoate 2-reductase
MTLAPGPIVILGAGAVGAFAGGMMSLAGEEVVLVDAWGEHVEVMRADGLTLELPEGSIVARPRACHLSEAHSLRRLSPSVAFLCVKLYDTPWAATLLADVVPTAPIVTLQNAFVEEVVARIAGWTRTLGAVGAKLDVALTGPGRVRRSRRRGGTVPVFKVGELSGRASLRAEAIAALLAKADTAAVTTRLWDERWAKLCANAITSGVSGISGLSLFEVYRRDDTRRLGIRLTGEACALGDALGFDLDSLFGLPPACWRAAAAGDAGAATQAMAALEAQSATMVAGGPSGTLQDLLKGRRTEVDFFNGYIAEQGRATGVATPTHAAVAALIRRMEAGEARPDLAHLAALGAGAVG